MGPAPGNRAVESKQGAFLQKNQRAIWVTNHTASLAETCHLHKPRKAMEKPGTGNTHTHFTFSWRKGSLNLSRFRLQDVILDPSSNFFSPLEGFI